MKEKIKPLIAIYHDYWLPGFMFRRLPNGSVQIWLRELGDGDPSEKIAEFEADRWAAIVACVSNRGPSVARHDMALEFHMQTLH